MDDLEFAKTVANAFSSQGLKCVVKKAALNGFEVAGFSKNPEKAPIQMILNGLGARKKINKLLPFYIFLNAILADDMANTNDKEIARLVERWKEDKISRNEISNEIQKYVESKNNLNAIDKEKNIGKDVEMSEVQKSMFIQQIAKKDGLIQELKQKNEQLQKRNNELKQSIIGYKKRNEDLQRNTQQLEQTIQEKNALIEIKQQLERQVEDYKVKVDEQSKLYVSMQEKIIIKDTETQALHNIIDELKQEIDTFKIEKEKVLCFCKTKIKGDFRNYDLLICREWNSEISQQLERLNFNQKWLVTAGFRYDIVLAIKEKYSDIEIFRNEKQIIKRLENRL